MPEFEFETKNETIKMPALDQWVSENIRRLENGTPTSEQSRLMQKNARFCHKLAHHLLNESPKLGDAQIDTLLSRTLVTLQTKTKMLAGEEFIQALSVPCREWENILDKNTMINFDQLDLDSLSLTELVATARVLGYRDLNGRFPRGNDLYKSRFMTKYLELSFWLQDVIHQPRGLQKGLTEEEINNIAGYAGTYGQMHPTNRKGFPRIFTPLDLMVGLNELDPEIGKRFDSHGIAKEYTSDQINALNTILTTGIDTDRDFSTVPLKDTPEMQALYAAGLGAPRPYAQGACIVIGSPDANILSEGVKGVILNDHIYPALPLFQKAFPDITFMRADEMGVVLKQWLEEYDHQQEHNKQEVVKKYVVPETAAIINRRAELNEEELAKFARASRAAPEYRRYPYQFQRLSELKMTNDRQQRLKMSGTSADFDPAKMLLACVSSTYGLVYYPHVDEAGRIVETSVFEMSPQQVYVLERRARQALVKTGQLDRLYPIITRMHNDNVVRFEQASAGEVICTYGKISHEPWIKIYSDGLLQFPVGEVMLDILYNEELSNTYASYNSGTGAFKITNNLLRVLDQESRTNQERAVRTAFSGARHEYNHALFDSLPTNTQRAILNLFDMNDSHIKEFTSLLAYSGYIDAFQIPSVVADQGFEFSFNGRLLTFYKKIIVNELLAWAAANEVLLEHESSLGNILAQNIINRLPPHDLLFLKQHHLVAERGTDFAKGILDAFRVAVGVFMSEGKHKQIPKGYLPTSSK